MYVPLILSGYNYISIIHYLEIIIMSGQIMKIWQLTTDDNILRIIIDLKNTLLAV